MILETINLKNFRNYSELFLKFNKKINIFIGRNAQGKTNILESIYNLAITKSHRTFIDTNLIKYGEKFFKINGKIKFNKEYETDLEIMVSSKGKKVSINGKAIRKISDYISRLNVIIFSPDDLDIVKGSPSIRRKFLNIELGQLSNKYLIYLNEYSNILKNRNEYLKRITPNNYDINYLNILNKQFADKAVEIYKIRKDFIEKINSNIKKIYKEMVGLKNEIKIKYITSVPLEGISDFEMKEMLINKLNDNLKREIAFSQTCIGPHRDDFIIYIGEKEAENFGSQGQQRMAVLCLKLSEIEIFNKTKGEYPILLLDDIFSELDNYKKNKIIKHINNKIQIFITTTDINNVNKQMLKKADVFSVKKAIITKRRGDLNG